MKIQKKTGSFYTPDFLADFIMTHILPYFKGIKEISFLEPSCGEGNILNSFNKVSFPKSVNKYFVKAVEKIATEIEKAKKQVRATRKPNSRYSFVKGDFLDFAYNESSRFNLIAGNPPYIKKSLLQRKQIKRCEGIHKGAGLSNNSIKNIWPSFLIKSSQLLDKKGMLAFVLPSELLQVNFSTELRQYISNEFDRIEIFTFDDLLFECKGQDTILLFAYKLHRKPGQFYTHIRNVKQLKTGDFVLAENNTLKVTDTKWTHHSINSDDLTFIHNISKRLNKINHYCNSRPGIVTAANKFFIVDNKKETEFKLTNYLKPIIQKGFYVNGSVDFDTNEFKKIESKGKPSKLLCISENDIPLLPNSVKRYLRNGVQLGLSTGYKCSIRNNWFVIPNLLPASDGLFFRRIHLYPKLVRNSAGVLVTDTAYQVEMKNDYTIESLIYSFYNSLTLAFAELSGRYYGGGVLELTPSEFKSLPVPYINIKDFKNYRSNFEAKTCIGDILDKYEYVILNSSLHLSIEEITSLRAILNKLVAKRFRK